MLRLFPLASRSLPGLPLALLVLAACGASDKDVEEPPAATDGVTDTGTPDTLPTTTDTAFPPADVGSMMLVEDGRGLGLFAMFVNQQPGFENLAYCAITNTVCLSGFPDPANIELPVPFAPDTRFDPVFSQYSYVGDTVSLGPYVADLYFNAETGLAFYYADLDDIGPVLGPVGVSFGVQWGDYDGEEDLVLREPLEIVTPRAGSMLRTVNASTILVEWVPELGGGDLHLFASTGEPTFLAVQWLVEDDGYFEVPIDDVMAGGIDPDTISFSLQRWNTGQVKHRGNTLDLVQISKIEFSSEYDYVGSRTRIEPSDNCAQAVNAAPLVSAIGTYTYWGLMTAFSDDIADQCGVGGGTDGLVRVDLPPLSSLRVEYNLPLGDATGTPLVRDAALWITDDCSNPSACLAGSNVNDDYIPELTAYFNASETETETVYIVLSGDGASGDVFWLDVVLEQLGDPMMVDECLAATQAAAIPEGSYYSEETAFLDSLNPGLSCTNSQTPGPDAMTKVTLLDGETLTALVTMPGADPAIYLMYNCTQPNTCAIGADVGLGTTEQLVYTNTSGFSENLYLVIDTKGAPLQAYFLTLDIL